LLLLVVVVVVVVGVSLSSAGLGHGRFCPSRVAAPPACVGSGEAPTPTRVVGSFL
jgi:hypothetical protein